MMINKRLIGTVSESKKYIAGNVLCQWISLVANIVMMGNITVFLSKLFEKTAETKHFIITLLVAMVMVAVRYICTLMSSKMSYLSSKAVKKNLREMIYKKLLRLGTSYREQVKTSEVVQVAVEGVDQLETYFGAYLPQFFYAVLAPLTLFVVLCFINVPCGVVLLICVPLIPLAIAAVQRWAKKLLSKYWGQYTALGDTFLENLQGLTTLKIYQADEFKQKEMNEESEKFRKITMKVLTMQLNSITIMDLIAYGGAALGVIMSVTQYRAGNVSISGCLFIILLSADFFIPMRMLGSFFHIAMNGMAASFHPALGVVALTAYITVGVIIPLLISKLSGEDGIRFRTKSGNLSGFVLDSLRGLSDIIQYGQGERRLFLMNKQTDDLAFDEQRMKRTSGRNQAFTNTVILFFDLVMLFASAMLYQNGQLEFIGVLIPTISLMSSFGPVVALANLGSTLQNTFAAGNRVLDILDESPVVEEVNGMEDITFTGASAENVTFAYGEEVILDDVNVDIEKGSVVGIIGRSGSGKSTLLKLFMRFWRTREGSIKLSETDVNSINTACIAQKVYSVEHGRVS